MVAYRAKWILTPIALVDAKKFRRIAARYQSRTGKINVTNSRINYRKASGNGTYPDRAGALPSLGWGNLSFPTNSAWIKSQKVIKGICADIGRVAAYPASQFKI